MPMVQPEATQGLREYLARVGFKDVDAVGLSPGLSGLRGWEDCALIAPDNIRKAKEAEAAGYSTVIIGCHPDANLYLLRDAVRIPVTDPLELAMHFCAVLAR